MSFCYRTGTRIAIRLSVALCLNFLAAVSGSSPTASAVDFHRDVAPILATRCLGCHNASEPSGELDLSTREQAMKGGESGPVIVPGDIEESYLLDRVLEGDMPPEEVGETLSKDDIEILTHWIRSGATWTEGQVLSELEFTTDKRAGGRDWWSLVPPKRPPLPDVQRSQWVQTPIDRFVLRKLEASGLRPSPEAERATLIRRVYFDVLGLPPSPEEVRAFVKDSSRNAYKELVDRLLDSPHYGERWARHWLDVVRFGETHGYEQNVPRKNAWPYRDYVIQSFNEDKPYDQFLMEQLAGDQMGVGVATSFLVGGSHDNVFINNLEGKLQQRMNDLDDMISTTCTAMLGLTAGCAKCHNHKFDPISQVNYYQLQAIFAGVKHEQRLVEPLRRDSSIARRDPQEIRRQYDVVERRLGELRRRLDDLAPLAVLDQELISSDGFQYRMPVNARRNVDRFPPVRARYLRFTIESTNELEPCLDELEVFSAGSDSRNVALSEAGAQATASSVFRNGGEWIYQIEHINDGAYGNEQSWISDEQGHGWVQIELPEPTSIDRVVWARDHDGRFKDRVTTLYKIEVALEPRDWVLVARSADRLAFDPRRATQIALPLDRLSRIEIREYDELQSRREELERQLPIMAYAGTFEPNPGPTHRLHRGEPLQKREQVVPGAIDGIGRPLKLSKASTDTERRMELAKWITDEKNPLTARVMVNRIWHYHFRQGLVSTPSNFGWHGDRPSHPKLLDWLAVEFVSRGWSMKAMHRLIMLSATYQQSSHSSATGLAKDSETRLLWRYPPWRLEAEPIRDSMLSVSGMLNLKAAGPGYNPFEENDHIVRVYVPKREFGPDEWRRMVYQTKPRMEQDSTFGIFDCPDASRVMPRRIVSTTALQALSLMNSPFVIDQSEHFARRIEAELPNGISSQVRRAFWLAFGRGPEEEELNRSVKIINEYGLRIFCRAIYNASEFIYVN